MIVKPFKRCKDEGRSHFESIQGLASPEKDDRTQAGGEA
jgi:hypothetical protein